METIGGNEVNPDYRTKTIAAEVSQEDLATKIQIKMKQIVK